MYQAVSIFAGNKKGICSFQAASKGRNIYRRKFAGSKIRAKPKGFFAKTVISLKECAETAYWLELLKEAEYITHEQYESIDADCKELLKLLTAITKTVKGSIHV